MNERLKKWFPRIENDEVARSTAKQGAIGVLIFAAMNLLGAFFAYYLNVDPIDSSALEAEAIENQVLGTLLVVPILMILAFRVYSLKGWFAGGFVLVWFVAEMSLKVLGGSTNIGWVIFYIAVAGMMVNGIRACWWFRSHESGANTNEATPSDNPDDAS